MSKIQQHIKKLLESTQIQIGQLDPNGYCNVGCWYCPVRYEGNPIDYRQHMPIELLEKILQNISHEKGQLVSENFNFFYTAHYNEILLYKHFAELLELFRKYNFYTIILSNGLTLSKKRSDLIAEYPDVVTGICLNIPAAEEEIWAKAVNQDKRNFSTLLANVDYAREKFAGNEKEKFLSIQVNGTNQNNSNYQTLSDFTTCAEEQKIIFQQRWPEINIFSIDWLSDRAGLLDQHQIVSHQAKINKSKNEMIIDCSHSEMNNRGRPFSWIHINSKGELFLCCDDYFLHYTFASLATNTLREVWLSDEHIKMIEKAFANICTRCTCAKYGEIPE